MASPRTPRGPGRRLRPVLVAAALSPVLTPAADSGPEAAAAPAPVSFGPRADHHLHIRSQEATDALLAAMEELDGRSLEGVRPATGARDVLERMDEAGVEGGALLSLGYLFGVPELDFEEERSLVRAENEYVASEAAAHGDRLVAFCGVNPLAEYALDEVRRCGRDERVAGLKLHLANSDVDLRDEEHLAGLGRVFAAADEHGLAVVIHLFTRHPDYGYEDAAIFIREVLPEVSRVPVQVAHLGGPGVFGEATEEASRAFVEALEGEHALPDGLYFDTAEVLVPPERAGDDEELAAELRRLSETAAERMEELGRERIVFGSDWTIAHDPPRYRGVVETLPLPDELRQRVFANTASYLELP